MWVTLTTTYGMDGVYSHIKIAYSTLCIHQFQLQHNIEIFIIRIYKHLYTIREYMCSHIYEMMSVKIPSLNSGFPFENGKRDLCDTRKFGWISFKSLSLLYWILKSLHTCDITIPAEFHVYPDENIFRWKLNWNIDGFSNLFGKCVLFVVKSR